MGCVCVHTQQIQMYWLCQCLSVCIYGGVFPVAYDLLQVVCRVEQEVFPPLIPVHHHGAINVHTKDTQRNLLSYRLTTCSILQLCTWHNSGLCTQSIIWPQVKQKRVNCFGQTSVRFLLRPLCWCPCPTLTGSAGSLMHQCDLTQQEKTTYWVMLQHKQRMDGFEYRCQVFHTEAAPVTGSTRDLPSLFLSKLLNVSRSFFSCSFRYFVNSLKSRLPSLFLSPDDTIFCGDMKHFWFATVDRDYRARKHTHTHTNFH